MSYEHTTSEDDADEVSLVGRWLAGKWRVDRLIGTGGMSSVYAATHRNGRRVAIKVLSPAMSVSSRARARFQREGYLANRVGHPNAVSVLDDDVSDGVAFLVMELLEGRTLEALRAGRGGRLEPEEVAWVGIELLAVLEAAHQHGIYHRDVKPANLFLTNGRELKLLDFGIASLRETPGAPSLTETTAVFGTPGFMAPEQARGRADEIGPSTDVWATGAVLFRLLTGRLVHDGGTASEMKIAAATQDAPAVASLVRGLPQALSAVVDRALRRAASDRWPSAAAMRDALVRAAERDGLAPRAPTTEPSHRAGAALPAVDDSSAVRSRGTRITVVVAVAVALIAVGGIAARCAPAPNPAPAPASPSVAAAGMSKPSIVAESPPPAARDNPSSTAVGKPPPRVTAPTPKRPIASRPAASASARPLASSSPHDLLKQRL